MKRYLGILWVILLWGSNQVFFAQCPAGEWPLEITIVPDSYPNETTWQLTSNNVPIANGNYLSDTICVDSTACLRYTIFDSYGDGICCGFGLGSYTLTLNGHQMATGGQFGHSESHAFNCAPGSLCENAIVVDTGITVAPQENWFYSFTPSLSGIYEIASCNLTSCDTRLWVYTSCANVDANGSSTGTLLYNDDNTTCGLPAYVQGMFIAGNTYLIKIGLKNGAVCGNAIPFSITYTGAMSSVLPIVKLTTVNSAINDVTKVPVTLQIIDKGLGQLNYENDTNYAYEGAIMAEWQGFTGPNYPKKNFDFDLLDALGNPIDTSLLGLPKENDWIFKAEYLDNTLIKNSIAYAFARKMGRYAPRTKHCELFLDGNYLGVYTLTEKVKRDKNRVDIAKLTSSDTTGSALTGGYIIEMNINGNPGAWNSQFPPINQATSPYPVEFKYVYPKADSILPVQGNYIKTYVDSFENALNGPNFQQDTLGYRAWIDVSTFIDFLIVNEVTMNYDSYGRSTYLYKEKDSSGGKLCIGPPWDYDRAMDSPPASGWVWQNCHPLWPYPFWWSKLYTDSVYRHELACRWFSLRENELSNGKFMMFIDSVTQLLNQGPAARNFTTWLTLNGVSYDQQIQNLKVFLYHRLTWIDQSLAPFGAELPTVQIPQDTTVCRGITYTAPYNPVYYYHWKPGPETPEITFTSPGPYLLEVSDAFGCERTLPMNVGISQPDSTFNLSSNDIQYTFTGNNGISSQYLWDFGDQTLWGNGLQGVHVYAVPGIYTVQMTVTDTLGCIGKSAQTLQITQGSIQVGIHPNPFQNDPTIVHNLPLDGAFTFMLYDAAGRKLKEYASPASPFTLETHGMAHGTYWLKCAFEGEIIHMTLVKV